MHFILGSFLVYTGIKAATADEEDEDPPQLPFVVWLPTNLNFVSAYDSKGSLRAQCEVNDQGEVVLPDDIIGAAIFRLVFILVRDFPMHAFYFTHFTFGSFFALTGIKTATDDERMKISHSTLLSGGCRRS